MSLVKSMIAFGMGYYIGSHYHPVVSKLFFESINNDTSVIAVTKTEVKVFGKRVITFPETNE